MKGRSKKMALGIALLSLIPFRTVVAPEWEITVVDEAGAPAADVEAKQTWQHYTVEREAHREERRTNGKGVVVFPERTIWSNVAMRAVGGITNILSTGVHTSFGPSAWVIAGAFEKCTDGSAVHVSGTDLPHTIKLKKYQAERCGNHP